MNNTDHLPPFCTTRSAFNGPCVLSTEVLRGLLLSYIFLVVPSTVSAQITTYTDRTTFEAAAGTTITETFNSFTTEEAFHTNPVDAGDFTISMTGPINDGFNFIDIPPHQDTWAFIDGTTSMNVFLKKTGKLIFTFDTPIKAFGADFRAFNDNANRVKFIVNGTSFNPPVSGNDQNTFFGFTSTSQFSVVEMHADFGVNDSFGMDNVTYASAVPEPGFLGSAGAALILGLFLFRRRSSRPAVPS